MDMHFIDLCDSIIPKDNKHFVGMQHSIRANTIVHVMDAWNRHAPIVSVGQIARVWRMRCCALRFLFLYLFIPTPTRLGEFVDLERNVSCVDPGPQFEFVRCI